MTALPEEIAEFIRNHHVMSLAAFDADGVWCASVFYYFDASTRQLLFLTSLDTRHGKMLCGNPVTAGTIAGQPAEITSIKGVQFSGQAIQLEAKARDEALNVYMERFPFAHSFHSPIWAIAIDHVKLTDNSRGFGHKLSWNALPQPEQTHSLTEGMA